MFGRVVEDTPSLAVVVGLPCVVVRVAVGILLALELNRLRRARVLRGNVEIEFIAQVTHWIWNCGLLEKVVPAGIGWPPGNQEVCRPSPQGGVPVSLRHFINRPLAGAPVIAATAAGLPSFLVLNV